MRFLNLVNDGNLIIMRTSEFAAAEIHSHENIHRITIYLKSGIKMFTGDEFKDILLAKQEIEKIKKSLEEEN